VGYIFKALNTVRMRHFTSQNMWHIYYNKINENMIETSKINI